MLLKWFPYMGACGHMGHTLDTSNLSGLFGGWRGFLMGNVDSEFHV